MNKLSEKSKESLSLKIKGWLDEDSVREDLGNINLVEDILVDSIESIIIATSMINKFQK